MPGGRTLCGRGGRFAFWARLASPDRLLVFFQGGGGCWDYRSCAPGTAMFDDLVDDQDNPSLGAGVLDLSDPRDPFRAWSVLLCRPAPAMSTPATLPGPTEPAAAP